MSDKVERSSNFDLTMRQLSSVKSVWPCCDNDNNCKFRGPSYFLREDQILITDDKVYFPQMDDLRSHITIRPPGVNSNYPLNPILFPSNLDNLQMQIVCKHLALFPKNPLLESNMVLTTSNQVTQSVKPNQSPSRLQRCQQMRLVLNNEFTSQCEEHFITKEFFCYDCNKAACTHCTLRVHRGHDFEPIEPNLNYFVESSASRKAYTTAMMTFNSIFGSDQVTRNQCNKKKCSLDQISGYGAYKSKLWGKRNFTRMNGRFNFNSANRRQSACNAMSVCCNGLLSPLQLDTPEYPSHMPMSQAHLYNVAAEIARASAFAQEHGIPVLLDMNVVPNCDLSPANGDVPCDTAREPAPPTNALVPHDPCYNPSLMTFKVTHLLRRDYSRIRKPLFIFGNEANPDTSLCRPWGVVCDKKGHIIIADRSNNRIQVFRTDGSWVRHFGQAGSEDGEFNRPAGIAVDMYGRLVICDKDNHRVQICTIQGKFVRAIGRRGSEPGNFNYPWDCAAAPKKDVIAVSDTRNKRIQILTTDGVFLRLINSTTNGSLVWRQMDSPRGLTFSTRSDKLLACDFNTRTIFEISDYDTANPRAVTRKYADVHFIRPQSAIMDDDGFFLVTDSREHCIKVINPVGQLISIIGCEGSEPGQFVRPSGIALTYDGKIVVVDFGNNRIQVF